MYRADQLLNAMNTKKRWGKNLRRLGQILLGIGLALWLSTQTAIARLPFQADRLTDPTVQQSSVESMRVAPIASTDALALVTDSRSLFADRSLHGDETSNEDASNRASWMEQGRVAYESGNYEQAIALWQQAAAAYEAANDRANQALAMSYLALAYQQLGQWEAANQAIAFSLAHIQASSEATASEHRLSGQVWNTQGSLQFAQGETEQAFESWVAAAAAYGQAGDEWRQLGSLINQAQAQQVLGLFLKARQTLERVEQSLQAAPDSSLKVLGLHSLGNVLARTGDTSKAHQVLDDSLAIANRLSLAHDASLILLSLGNVARSEHEYTEALEFYQRAEQAAVDPQTRVQALLNQMSLGVERGWAIADLVPTIQTQLESLPPGRSTVYERVNFAKQLLAIEGWEPEPESEGYRKAAGVLAIAIQQAQTLEDSRAEAYALGYLGRVYEKAEQWPDAYTLTQEALLIAQSLSAADIAYQWQWQLGRILKAQEQRQAAIAAYTAAYETLQGIRSDLVAISADLQFSFRESVEPVYRELVDLLLQRDAEVSNPPENLTKAREVIESLQIAELDNFFRAACVEGQAVPLERVDQAGVAVVYPIILSDRLELILSLPGQALRQYTTSVSQSTVETTLTQWRTHLEKPFTDPEGKRLGQQGYEWLIQPIEADLAQASVETLVFVLDGVLRNVPMAALYDGQEYLLERYDVAIAPGLRLLNPQPLDRSNLEVLAAGLTEARHGFSALQNVALELDEIQAEVSSTVLLNQTFTSTALGEKLRELPFPAVHLATHGQFSSDLSETFVLAWDKPILVNELSSLLRARDDLSPRALELLVLSACETAAGDKRAALGLAGIAVQAGARSTLASLWSLDDASAAYLIGLFYQALETEQSKAKALNIAQRSLLNDPDYRHPLYWAPYVLLGNWL